MELTCYNACLPYRHIHIIQNNCFKVQSHPGLYSTFEASLGYMKTLFKKKLERKEGRKKKKRNKEKVDLCVATKRAKGTRKRA